MADTNIPKNVKPVDEMTSSDFQNDSKAHLICVTNSVTDNSINDVFASVIKENAPHIRGRVVLNVNCGLGLLALFAAKAGAKRVYAVDTSNALDYLERIVEANNLSDVVFPVKKPLRDIELPEESVDIIICNWFGPSLLYTSACVDMIYARNKWLNKKTGIIIPDVAKLYVAGIEDKEYRRDSIDWWQNVYGFRMNPMRRYAIQQGIQLTITPGSLITSEECLKIIDLTTATLDDLKVHSDYMMEINCEGQLDGIAMYFEVYFTKTHQQVSFRTCPRSQFTSYQQSVYFFDEPILVKRSQIVFGLIKMMSAEPQKYNLNNMRVSMDINNIEPKTFDAVFLKSCSWVLHSWPIDCEKDGRAIDAEDSPKAPTIHIDGASSHAIGNDYLKPIKDFDENATKG